MEQPVVAFSRWECIRDRAFHVEAVIENALLVVMVLTIFAQVGLRFLFNISLDWAEEVARISFVWLVFLGAMTALRRRAHLGVDVLVRFLPPESARWAERVARLCIIATLLLFVYYGTVLTLDSYIIRTPVLGLPWTYIYAVVPLSALGMLLTLLGKR